MQLGSGSFGLNASFVSMLTHALSKKSGREECVNAINSGIEPPKATATRSDCRGDHSFRSHSWVSAADSWFLCVRV